MAKHTHHPRASHREPAPLSRAWTGGPALETFTSMGEPCGRACAAWQQEVLRFATERLRKDSDTGWRLASCQNWADAAKVQQEWAQTTVEDYFAEANRLAQLASTLGTDLFRSLGVRAEEGENGENARPEA